MSGRHSLIVVSGPTKAGKTTLVELICSLETGLQRVITATTRDPRLKEDKKTIEADGKDYYFVDASYFNRSGIILEKAEVHGNWYGTPKKSVDQPLRKGKTPLWILDVQGAGNIHTRFEQSYRYKQHGVNEIAKITYVFLLPTYSEMVARLERAYDKNKERRIESAKMEIGYLLGDVYDYVIDTSRSIEESQRDLRAVILNEESELAKKCRLADRKTREKIVNGWMKS